MRQRERARDRDTYDNVLAIDKAARERSLEGQVVLRAAGAAREQTRQAHLRRYLLPSRVSGEPPQAVLDDWTITVQEIPTRSGRHRHQGGALLYVLQGRGHSIVAGQRLKWEEGDLLVLPPLPDGVDHQHFNDDPSVPARLVTLRNAVTLDWLAASYSQLGDHPDYRVAERRSHGRADLHDQLAAYADRASERAGRGKVVVRAVDVPWLQNRQALVRRYLWTSRGYGVSTETALDDWRVFAQRIKVHSGKHRHQGGLVIYVIEGEGYTEVEGKRLEWEAGDLLLLPLKIGGGPEHQHFNKSEDKPARWIAFNNSTSRGWSGSQMVQTTQHPDFKEDG